MKNFCARCKKCNARCGEVVEDVYRTPSRCILIEANKFTRHAAKDDVDEKLRAWANAAPPASFSGETEMEEEMILEMAKILVKGTLYLDEDREVKSLLDDPNNPSSSNEDSEDSDCCCN